MTSDLIRVGVRAALLGTCAMTLAGCMGPTYGTGKSQGGQLFSDLDNIVSLGSTGGARPSYAPRPELVKPKTIGALPPPREAVSAANDADWPESPERRSARLQAAAPDPDTPLPVGYMTAAKDGIPVERSVQSSTVGRRTDMENSWLDPKAMAGQRVAATDAAKNTRQGSPEVRRYLSEPPLAYRAPAATAPVGVQGDDEEVKERRMKGTTSVGSKLKSLWPF
jgi:hypothetical protein